MGFIVEVEPGTYLEGYGKGWVPIITSNKDKAMKYEDWVYAMWAAGRVNMYSDTVVSHPAKVIEIEKEASNDN